jgi:hypothetical protein
MAIALSRIPHGRARCVLCAVYGVRCVLCTVCCVLCAVRCARCAVRCALCAACGVLCAARCLSYGAALASRPGRVRRARPRRARGGGARRRAPARPRLVRRLMWHHAAIASAGRKRACTLGCFVAIASAGKETAARPQADRGGGAPPRCPALPDFWTVLATYGAQAPSGHRSTAAPGRSRAAERALRAAESQPARPRVGLAPPARPRPR